MSARPNSVVCVGAAVRRDDRVLEPSWLGLVLLCRHVSGEPRGDGREVDAAGFFGADQLRTLGDDIEPWCAWVVARGDPRRRRPA